MAQGMGATRRGALRMVVGAAVVALDLWFASDAGTGWLATIGATSPWGWSGVRAAVAVAALGLLFALRASTPAEHGITGPVPTGAGPAMVRLCAWVLGLYVVFFAAGVVAVRAGWLDPTPLPQDIDSRDDVASTLLLMCLVAPIAEELVYRGLAVPALRVVAGPRTTVLLSGALFWALHVAYGYPLWLVHYALAGMILAWAFLRTNRLWVAVLLHALGNVLMVADDLLRLYAPDVVRALLGPRGESLI